MSIKWAKQPREPDHEAKNFFACQGLVQELFSVAQIHMSKAQKDIGSAHKQLKIILRPLVGIKYSKRPKKPNHEAETVFACQGLVGEHFSVAQIHMSKAQKYIGSANKQLKIPPEVLHGHKMGKKA